jgi:hypothetical protein
MSGYLDKLAHVQERMKSGTGERMPKTERADCLVDLGEDGDIFTMGSEGICLRLKHMSAFWTGVVVYDTPEHAQGCSDQTRGATHGV